MVKTKYARVLGNTWITTNRSCDFCTVRRRKCDGDGRNPCSRCKDRGATRECVYRERKQQSPRARRGQASTNPDLPTWCQRDDRTIRLGADSLKRCTLSASPATGLVGMQENELLSDYFNCIGFFPITCESVIREAMVSIMMASSLARASGSNGCGVQGQDSKTGREGTRSTRAMNCKGDETGVLLDSCTSVCAFWCAVALGGLVKGRPVENVSAYVRRAEMAMEGCSGANVADLARAQAILGYLHGYLGKFDIFLRYLDLSDRFLSDCTGEGLKEPVPLALAEVVAHAKDLHALFGDRLSPADMEAFCHERVCPHKISMMAAETDIYQWVMQAYRSLLQRFVADAYVQEHGLGMPLHDLDDVPPGRWTTDSDVCIGGRSMDAPRESDPIALAREYRIGKVGSIDFFVDWLRDTTSGFERLEQILDSSSTGVGYGGIIINGTLVFIKAAQRDIPGALKRLKLCVGVFERYPGLCRFPCGFHIAHVMIAVVASMREREHFETLRAAVNNMRDPKSPAIPPFEEYRGLSGLCDRAYCRSWERVLQTSELAFPTQVRQEQHQHHGSRSQTPEVAGMSTAGVTFHAGEQQQAELSPRSDEDGVAYCVPSTASVSPIQHKEQMDCEKLGMDPARGTGFVDRYAMRDGEVQDDDFGLGPDLGCDVKDFSGACRVDDRAGATGASTDDPQDSLLRFVFGDEEIFANRAGLSAAD